MYAIEFFLFCTAIGIVCVIKLVQYLSPERYHKKGATGPEYSCQQLIDMYVAIYRRKDDDQMLQLAHWRELALQNYKARENGREKILKVEQNVSFLADYQKAREAGKLP